MCTCVRERENSPQGWCPHHSSFSISSWHLGHTHVHAQCIFHATGFGTQLCVGFVQPSHLNYCATSLPYFINFYLESLLRTRELATFKARENLVSDSIWHSLHSHRPRVFLKAERFLYVGYWRHEPGTFSVPKSLTVARSCCVFL